MAVEVTQTFVPGPRLIDGSDLNRLVGQINAALASVGAATVSIPIAALSALANTQVYELPIQYPFKVTTAGFRVGAPVTTGSKLATATTQVAGVSITGGVISLTSAALTPTGTLLAGTAITAGNTGTAGATLGVVISAVTAFSEGSGQFEFTVLNTAVQ